MFSSHEEACQLVADKVLDLLQQKALADLVARTASFLFKRFRVFLQFFRLQIKVLFGLFKPVSVKKGDSRAKVLFMTFKTMEKQTRSDFFQRGLRRLYRG